MKLAWFGPQTTGIVPFNNELPPTQYDDGAAFTEPDTVGLSTISTVLVPVQPFASVAVTVNTDVAITFVVA